MRFRFNADAAQRLAVEMRRASWGVVVFGGGLYAKHDSVYLLLVAALGWLALQIAAFVLDNLEGES